MSTTPIIVPDTPQDIRIPGPPRSRFAKRFLERSGNAKRAERLDQCGRHRDLRDVNNHQKREYQHCMCPFCRHCAVYLAHKTFERWESTLKGIMDEFDGPCITFIEASIPHSQRSLERVEEGFKLLDGMGIRWESSPGYKGNNLILRVLLLENSTMEHWASIFPPDATVSVMTHPVCKLIHLFKVKLLALDVSEDDPIDRAEQAVLLDGVRRFRSHGIRIEAGNEENDLFAESEVSANNSPEVLQQLENTIIAYGPPERDICSHCGEKFIEESQWVPKDAPELRDGEHRWYPRH